MPEVILPEARETFARLMQEARSGPLSQHARQKLSQARQLLRRAKRPAMNTRRSTKRNPHWTPSALTRVAQGLQKFGFSAPEARRLAAQAEGERGISNVNETVERIVRAHTHVSVGGLRNPTRKERFSLYVQDSTGQSTFRGEFYTLPKAKKAALMFARSASYPLVEIYGTGGKIVWSSRGRLKTNPAGKLQRLGRAVEVRYRREIGRQPGFYKHAIKSRKAGLYTIPAGWVYVSGKSILITEGSPRV